MKGSRKDCLFRCSIFLIVPFIVSLMGGNLFAVDLSAAIQAAKKYDAAYLAGRAQSESVFTKRAQALAELLPRLDAYGNETRNSSTTSFDNSTQSDISRDYNSGGYTVRLTQPIFQMRSFMSYAQSRHLVLQAEAQLSQIENDLILRTAQAYYDVLLAMDRLNHIRAQKKAVKEQLAAANKSYKIGAAAITDVDESKAKFELVTAQEIEAELDLENKRRSFTTVTGPDIGTPQPVTENPAFPVPETLDAWTAKADRNPAVKAARAAMEVAKKEVGKARAGHFPSLDLVATYGDNIQGSDSNNYLSTDTRVKNKTIGLQLQVPIFSGGGTQARVNEAVKLREKAKKDYENTHRQVTLQLSQAFLGVVSGLAQIRALEAGVASSETALKSNSKGYKVGMRTNVDVLNAQQQLCSAKNDMNRARYSTWMQYLRLRLGAGETLDTK